MLWDCFLLKETNICATTETSIKYIDRFIDTLIDRYGHEYMEELDKRLYFNYYWDKIGQFTHIVPRRKAQTPVERMSYKKEHKRGTYYERNHCWHSRFLVHCGHRADFVQEQDPSQHCIHRFSCSNSSTAWTSPRSMPTSSAYAATSSKYAPPRPRPLSIRLSRRVTHCLRLLQALPVGDFTGQPFFCTRATPPLAVCCPPRVLTWGRRLKAAAWATG